MGDFMVATRCKPERNIVRGEMSGQNAVRVYRDSPETVCLQLRREREYSNVHLYEQEAREIAAALIRSADEFAQFKPEGYVGLTFDKSVQKPSKA